MRGLRGKRILVAGSAAGVGEGTAYRLAGEGCDLFLGDIDVEGMTRVAEKIRGEGGKVASQAYDLADPASIEALLKAAVEFLGGLDGVANVAAAQQPEIIGNDIALVEADIAVWEKTLRANTLGTAWVCKHAIPHLIEAGGGAIVNVSSGASHYGEAVRPAYAASKAGVNAVTRHIARAYGKQNVRANVVSPGFILTPKVRKYATPEFIEGARGRVSLNRVGEPADEAAGIAFLLSDDAEWVTGQAWSVNGGAHYRD